MTAPTQLEHLPDETFNALVDDRLSGKADREARQKLEADPQGLARSAAWRRQSEALSAAFSPIAHEPLPLSVLLKLQGSSPGWRIDAASVRTVAVFLLGMCCGLGLSWLAYRGFRF